MMRAKMQVTGVTPCGPGEELEMSAVCGDGGFGPEGESEDNTFARFTPSGRVALTVNNPALVGRIRPGMKFYVDFTVVPE